VVFGGRGMICFAGFQPGKGGGRVCARGPLGALAAPHQAWATFRRECATQDHRQPRAGGWHRAALSPSIARHTFAVMFLRGRGDAFTLQVILGHEGPAVTRSYVELAEVGLEQTYRSPLDSLSPGGKWAPAQERQRVRRQPLADPGAIIRRVVPRDGSGWQRTRARKRAMQRPSASI
jgi:hypothetical protein